ncbi:hypothetical protein KEM54_000073 [Ascosphaera aggregata]|nr:hypothetical protein KEM54_000073 [Ascosphaera aggregata]
MNSNIISTLSGISVLGSRCLRQQLSSSSQHAVPSLLLLPQQQRRRFSASWTPMQMPKVIDMVRSSRNAINNGFGSVAGGSNANAITRPHHLHVFTHKHNTHITLTRPNSTVILSLSCGNIGLRKAQRKTYDAAHRLTAHTLSLIQERGYLNPLDEEKRIKKIEVIFKGYGLGREAFTKALLGTEGKNIRPLVCKVTDATKLKFGGPRSRATRRLG